MSDNLDNQVEYVQSLAIAFRMAISRAQESGELSRTVIASFPRACCGYTSDLLQRYLDKHGIKTWYVSGTYRDPSTNDSQSHAWLELADGTVIDITGDQFRFEPHPLKNDCPVYCDKPNEFFNLFELDLPCEYEVLFSKDVLRKEKEAYDIVCKFL